MESDEKRIDAITLAADPHINETAANEQNKGRYLPVKGINVSLGWSAPNHYNERLWARNVERRTNQT